MSTHFLIASCFAAHYDISAMWTCSCGEQIEDQFDACWRCTGKVAGVEEPGTTPVKCLRCEIFMEYKGAKSFHEGGYIADALGFTFHEKLDLFACPRCGRVELFLANVGRELRSRDVDFSTVPSSDQLTPPSGSAGKDQRRSLGQSWNVIPRAPLVSSEEEE